MSAVIDHGGHAHGHDDHAHDHPHGWRRWVFATNHKDIGTLYLLFALTMLMVGGVLLCGLASALYIGAQLGRGPRDGLMTGLARRTGRSIRLVRTGLEVVVVLVGLALGGVLGLGTVLYALAIGPLTQLLLPLFLVDVDAGRDGRPKVSRRGRDTTTR